MTQRTDDREDLISALKNLVKFIRDDMSDRETGPSDAGCIRCTLGTTPDHLNTGFCPLHKAEAVLRFAALELRDKP